MQVRKQQLELDENFGLKVNIQKTEVMASGPITSWQIDGETVETARLWFFLWSCMDVRIGLCRRLSTEELELLNCGVGEDSCESLGLQGDPTSPF